VWAGAAGRVALCPAAPVVVLIMRRLLSCLFLVVSVLIAPCRAQESETQAVRELKRLVERQKTLLARAEQADNEAAIEDVRPLLQRLVFDYESHLRDFPDEPAAYASYGLLLSNPLIDEPKRALALLVKANQLDRTMPLVKNQIGKILAEEGRPLLALPYFLAAVELEPTEPLYHYQIGTLINEARDDFLKSGEWTREALDKAMSNAFEQARTHAPENLFYAYRYCESFYDLAEPDWDRAVAEWQALEARLSKPVEVQTVRLHQANVRLKQGQADEAASLLATVTDPVLAEQKQKLIAQLPVAADK
jgi:tetratricopeptide (TPR) repeat protein